MEVLETMTYDVTGGIARITLNRPERGNGITGAMPGELTDCVERADCDPEVHVMALSGNGQGTPFSTAPPSPVSNRRSANGMNHSEITGLALSRDKWYPTELKLSKN